MVIVVILVVVEGERIAGVYGFHLDAMSSGCSWATFSPMAVAMNSPGLV